MSRHSKVLIASGVMVVGVAAFAVFYTRDTTYRPEVEIAPPPAVAAAAAIATTSPAKLPARMAIPKIAVDAVIQEKGLVAGNRMAAPTNFTDVGWYKYGTIPGHAGTAVFYAHLDNGLGLDGVFKDLDKLTLGDEIDITTASGTPLRYIVDDIETYPYQAVPPQALGEGAGDGKAHISLLTCAGEPTQDPTFGYTYDHRLVIYATLAP